MLRGISICFFVALWQPAASLPLIAQEKGSFVSELNASVPGMLAKNNAPGVAVGVVENGRVVFAGGYGFADVAKKRPMTADTVINIASVSKSVTALGAMALAKKYKLDLDAPVNDRLHRWKIPDSKFDVGGVTLTRLLSHSAGISLFSVLWFPADGKIPAFEEVLRGETAEKKPVFIEKEPGKQWSYSGGGYMIVQLLIEETSGKSFDKYMERAVFRPLGMKDTGYFSKAVETARQATIYDESSKPIPRYKYVGESAAGVNTTARDFARLLCAYAAGGGKFSGKNIIRPEMFRKIFEKPIPVELEGVKDAFYGLGHGVHKTKNGDTILYHSGGNPGVRAYFLVSLITGNGMIVISNSDNGVPVMIDIIKKWSEHYKTDIQQIY